ncbi:MAG: glycoside hydrolase family 10 protein, partial [Planctomycetota bacterium]
MNAFLHRLPAVLAVAVAWTLAAATSCPAQSGAGAPPPLAREFRGAWVATVDNIDFPSRPGLTAPQLRAELDAMVARAVELKLNALVFQVRPSADAFYESTLEPWSEFLVGTQGKRPDAGFDPLAYVIERCHERGLQLHAWFNPFRAGHPACKSPPAATHVTQRAPQLCVTYGKYRWMDPGEPLAQKWSLATVQEVVRKYDVDGVHVDDYFYPYPEGKTPFPDDASYARYRADGGKEGRGDWRRDTSDEDGQQLRRALDAAELAWTEGEAPDGEEQHHDEAGGEAEEERRRPEQRRAGGQGEDPESGGVGEQRPGQQARRRGARQEP